MSRAGFCQLLCVILLGVFIAFSLNQEKEIIKSAPEIIQEVTESVSVEGLEEFDKARLSEQFGFSEEYIDSFAYYGSQDIMNVREILVLKLKEGTDGTALTEIIEKRAEDKYNTFKDYDAQAAALLESRVTENENGVIFFIVHENAQTGLEAFTKSIDE